MENLMDKEERRWENAIWCASMLLTPLRKKCHVLKTVEEFAEDIYRADKEMDDADQFAEIDYEKAYGEAETICAS